MNYINKAEVAGIVTGTPETTVVGQKTKCTFTVMTEYAYHKESKAVIEKTYHRCVIWESKTVGKETIMKIKAGTKVHVTGRQRQHPYGDREPYIQASKFNFVRGAERLECPTTL